MQDTRLRAGSNALVWMTPECPLELGQARRVVDLLVHRHEAFRTLIVRGPDGLPEQRTDAPAPDGIHVLDEAADARRSLELAIGETEFDLSREGPLRVGAVRAGERVTELLFVISHCVFDGHSIPPLQAEFALAVREVARGAEPAATRRRHQPLDSAFAERSGPLAQLRAASTAHWARAVRDIPNRMFVPAQDDVMHHYGATYRTDRLAPLLALAARRHRTTPAVVHAATVHALLAALSAAPHSVVRSHFAGRTDAEAETIGCFHRILPVVVATSDRPGFGALVERVAMQTLRAQSRYRIDYLALRQLISAEERRRGVAIADGTIVNFSFDEGFESLQRGSEEELLAAADAAVGELELLMGRNETTPEHRGLDSYLMTRIADGVTVTYATFNGAVFTAPQMRTLLIGPEQLLAAHLQGDLDWDGIGRIARSGDPYAPAPPAVPVVGVDLVLPERVDEALASHPAVRASFTTVTPGTDGTVGLECRVIREPGSGEPLSEAELREHLLCQVRPGAATVAPRRFLIEGQAKEEAGRTEPSVLALVAAVLEVNGMSTADEGRSYAENGGALGAVPAIIDHLAEQGYTGLGPHDFTLPMSLRSLGRRLHPGQE
ncbi:condensation domain-containing protein [Streptomyces sp. Go-475]|uniref:condensation domain-containing protein n=1 Tax=Streptomyces sp. Go-475 TaxID=2072505 RepID=UPI000DF0AF8C|nr:condensation domain-containing protein [Streptomyces sp. Go-475]AXE89474.1 Dimodular nonribosomal peptide synthase [Streptomyces sp. Go-475]